MEEYKMATYSGAPVELVADRLRRGVMRWLVDLGYQPLPEFILKSGRRVDVFGLDDRGDTVAVEIKSGLPDFRADSKWGDYLDFCDRFYFAVGTDFPLEHLPDGTGIVVADGFGADVYCEAPRTGLAAARRRALILRFACASVSCQQCPAHGSRQPGRRCNQCHCLRGQSTLIHPDDRIIIVYSIQSTEQSHHYAPLLSDAYRYLPLHSWLDIFTTLAVDLGLSPVTAHGNNFISFSVPALERKARQLEPAPAWRRLSIAPAGKKQTANEQT